jgi:hypothetical protein
MAYQKRCWDCGANKPISYWLAEYAVGKWVGINIPDIQFSNWKGKEGDKMKTLEQAFKEWWDYVGSKDCLPASARAGFDAGYQASALTWSNEPPTEPGWYGICTGGVEYITEIHRDELSKVWGKDVLFTQRIILPPLPGERNAP